MLELMKTYRKEEKLKCVGEKWRFNEMAINAVRRFFRTICHLY
ncbi:hypothetical protein [Bacillus pseudomycoides]|nr:hypothetical protein [Bacillus pseudomycoides]